MKIEQELIHKALSHKVRLFIVKSLIGNLKKSVGTLTEECKHYGLSDPAISQHLKKLEHYGLIKSRRTGRTIIYSVEPAMKTVLSKFLTLGVK